VHQNSLLTDTGSMAQAVRTVTALTHDTAAFINIDFIDDHPADGTATVFFKY
jgi:hypothetical protein